MTDWHKQNHERLRIYKRKYNEENKSRVKEQKRAEYQRNKIDYQIRSRKHYEENRDKIIRKSKEWHKANPRSSKKYSLELQLAMNNVRERDHNTCQWYNCGLTHKEAPIHVHHIFPRSEYPELELIQQYMICYCLNHHGLWHRYRGDISIARFLGIGIIGS